jgi:hypothetical protein
MHVMDARDRQPTPLTAFDRVSRRISHKILVDDGSIGLGQQPDLRESRTPDRREIRPLLLARSWVSKGPTTDRITNSRPQPDPLGFLHG